MSSLLQPFIAARFVVLAAVQLNTMILCMCLGHVKLTHMSSRIRQRVQSSIVFSRYYVFDYHSPPSTIATFMAMHRQRSHVHNLAKRVSTYILLCFQSGFKQKVVSILKSTLAKLWGLGKQQHETTVKQQTQKLLTGKQDPECTDTAEAILNVIARCSYSKLPAQQ